MLLRLAGPLPPSRRVAGLVDVPLDRHHLGVVGGNARGKRSVLLALARELQRGGLKVERVDFDSHRDTLREQGDSTVARFLGGLRDNTDIVVRFGLSPVWWRRLKSLSTGEIRKVILASAVSKSPNVLLLDRPFDGLDAKSRKTLSSLLVEVCTAESSKAARPLVQGIKWKERAPVRIVIATHRPETELPRPLISHVLRCGLRSVDLLSVDALLSMGEDEENNHPNEEAAPTSTGIPITNTTNTTTARDEGLRDPPPATTKLLLRKASSSSSSTAAHMKTMNIQYQQEHEGTNNHPLVSQPVLEVRNLTVFPVRSKDEDVLDGKGNLTRPLLDRVSWVIHPRDVWFLQGENGASKSVLLSCAMQGQGLLQLASMQHARREWSVETDPDADRRRKRPPVVCSTREVGFVSTELHVSLLEKKSSETIREFLVGGCAPGSASLDDILAIVDYLELDRSCLERTFHELSAGEQKLAMIARAAASKPKLLILDEPCQSLDARHRRNVAHLVEQLCTSPESDMACVFVTHHEDELPRVVTHRLVLSQGKILSRGPYRVGTPARVLK